MPPRSTNPPAANLADVLASHRQALRGLAERLANVEQAHDDGLDATAAELAAINAKLDALTARLDRLESLGTANLAGLMAPM